MNFNTCNCKNAFTCVNWRTCERAAKARQTAFANRAEVAFTFLKDPFYSVLKGDAAVSSEFKKLRDGALWSFEHSRNNFHVNLISGAFSNTAFSEKIKSREDARRIGAYLAKPAQALSQSELRSGAFSTRVQTQSSGRLRHVLSFLKRRDAIKEVPALSVTVVLMQLAEEAGVSRKIILQEEKNKLLERWKKILISAFHEMQANQTEYVFLKDMNLLITRDEVLRAFNRIGKRT